MVTSSVETGNFAQELRNVWNMRLLWWWVSKL